jgi:hypothetical protein
VVAILNFINQRGGVDNRVAGVLDGLPRPNWAEIKVHRHVLKKEDGGLGSEKWFLRTYGQGHDPVRWPCEWAEEVVDTIMGWRGASPFKGGVGFTGQYADWERQGRCSYFLMLDSERLFSGHGDIMKSEVLEITDIVTEGRWALGDGVAIVDLSAICWQDQVNSVHGLIPRNSLKHSK